MGKRPRPDPKASALRQNGCLHPRPDAVQDPLFAASAFFDPRDVVQVKYEMIRRVELDAQTVSASAEAFGFSRPAYYQARAVLAQEGLPGLVPKKRGPRGGHKLTEEVVAFIVEARQADPAAPAGDLAERVLERFGISVHPRSVERALARREKKRQ